MFTSFTNAFPILGTGAAYSSPGRLVDRVIRAGKIEKPYIGKEDENERYR
jgi:hypothetical protein